VLGQTTVPHEAEDECRNQQIEHEDEDFLDNFGLVSGLGEDFLEHGFIMLQYFFPG